MTGSGYVGPVSGACFEDLEQAEVALDHIEYRTHSYDAMVGADALVLVIEWDALRALDLARVKSLMIALIFNDLRNNCPQAMIEG